MEPFIVPIVSTGHAPALARVKTLSFLPSQLSINALPTDKPEQIREWYTAREIKSLREAKTQTFAVVKQVNGERGDDDGDEDPASWITFPSGGDGDNEKQYVIMAYARWENLSPPGEKNVEEVAATGSAFQKAERDDVLVNPDLMPEGSNVALNAVFRQVQAEKRKQHLDQVKDCVLDILCTNPGHERRGFGRRLLEHGIDMADAAGKRIYLEATPKGVPLYERLGWKTIDMAEFTLADYGSQGEGDGEGKLKFNLMMRELGGK